MTVSIKAVEHAEILDQLGRQGEIHAAYAPFANAAR